MLERDGILTTERLVVRPMAAGDFDALLQGLEDPDRTWADGYPLDESLVSAAMVQERQRTSPGAAVQVVAADPWTQYQVILADGDVVVGDLTFLEPPDHDRVAMITFGIAPSCRGNGYATEMLRALVPWLRARTDVRGIRADTDLVNATSHQVLRAAGLRVVQDDGDRQLYELRWEHAERTTRSRVQRRP
ncbi:GNAT family N-acetyltransferase [Patulibacter sp.]|uniref:GNAT family N-acetyltransferase n=1 Tax=Patulibacter sp. TaxID=1912859 RepID=UPI002726FCA0|nr:GNAT family N-acetyltransferase [Patulibacter sp.]MDO9407034.1 GNAT family N-acetyltransferase [Patulibacter sp.]